MTAGDHYPGGSPATASLSSASRPAPIQITTAGRVNIPPCTILGQLHKISYATQKYKIFPHTTKNSHSTAQRKFHSKRAPQPEKVKEVIIQSFTENEDYIVFINKDENLNENTGVAEGAGRQQKIILKIDYLCT
jgi:hypothetical protein